MDKAQFLTRFHHAKHINSEADFPLPEPGKPAAVLLPILEYKNELTVLFMPAKSVSPEGNKSQRITL